ncbi:MAG: mechanosensitive ion channel family protein [Planctomycetota bacterium]
MRPQDGALDPAAAQESVPAQVAAQEALAVPDGADLVAHLQENWLLYAAALYLILLAVKVALRYPRAVRTAAIAAGLVTVPVAALLIARPRQIAAGDFKYLWAAFWVSLVYIVGAIGVGAVAQRLARRRPDPIPALQQTLVTWTVTLAAAIVIFLFLEINLKGLFAGVAVSSLVIGFAFQKTFANLFAGLSLDLDRSVRQGDWIQLQGGALTARVVDKSMRVTRFLTLDNELITVPNNVLSAETIHNLSQPDQKIARVLTVGASYKDPPIKVKDVLRQILLSDPEILSSPPARVRVVNYGDFSIDYRMRFWIADYARHREVEDRIMTRIWYAFRQNDIEIPFPIRTVHHKEQAVLRAEAGEMAAREEKSRVALASVAIFAEQLTEAEIAALAVNAVAERHLPGELVIARGERTDNFYVVLEGTCIVDVPGVTKPVLEAGAYFGEMAVLVGEPRTADIRSGPQGCVLLRLDRDSLLKVFSRHPELRETLEKTRAVRREDLRERGALPLGPPTARPRLTAKQWMLRGVRALVPW